MSSTSLCMWRNRPKEARALDAHRGDDDLLHSNDLESCCANEKMRVPPFYSCICYSHGNMPRVQKEHEGRDQSVPGVVVGAYRKASRV